MRNKKTLDAVDRDILFQLRLNGRMSNVELARRVGLTPPPCLRRVKRLEEDGVITGYRAVIDPVLEGRAMEVIVSVEIVATDFATVEAFETAVAGFAEVLEVRRVFGVPDYYLRVAVADANEYEHFQMRKLAVLPAVARAISHPTVKLIKGEG